LKYHRLLKTDFLEIDAYANLKIEDEILNLNSKFSKDSLEIVEKKELYELQSALLKGMSKTKKIKQKIININSLLQAPDISKFKIDSLINERELLIFEQKTIKQDSINSSKKLIKIKADVDSYFLEELEKKEQIKDEKTRELRKKKKELGLEGFDVTWFSFGVKAKNNDFKIFEESNAMGHQFINMSFVSQRISTSLSRYRSTSYRNQDVYWTIGLFLDYTTNFNSLSKVLIEERRPINGNNLQEQVKSINAYTGNYEEGIFEFTLYYDYYRFFGTYNSILGIHINPSYNFSLTTNKPLTNIYFGVIVPFGNSKKQSSKLNVEVFYNKQDIFNYLDKDNNNGSFGLRATLPVNLITK